MARQNIYDNEAFFEDFREKRTSEINFNDCIETPILFSMLPDLRGKDVLDIGCGMGQHTRKFAEMGAASVLGIDISEKMLAWAVEHNSAEAVTYRRMAMEDMDALEERFDVIISSCGKASWESLVGKTRGKTIDALIHGADCEIGRAHV